MILYFPSYLTLSFEDFVVMINITLSRLRTRAKRLDSWMRHRQIPEKCFQHFLNRKAWAIVRRDWKCDESGLRNVVSSHGNFVICFDRVDFKRNSCTLQSICQTVNVQQRLTVGSDFRVQSPTVISWTPTIVTIFTGHVQRRFPRGVRWPNDS